MTEVSPRWNEALGKSLMMKKVKILIGSDIVLPDKKSEEMENVMNRSCRHYRNARLIFAMEFSFKRNSHKMIKYLVAMSPTLLELNVENLSDLHEVDVKLFVNLDLSVLKVLKMNLVSRKAAEQLLLRCESLSKLEFKSTGLRPSNVLRSFLERNQSLKEITLDEFEYRAFFAEDISEIANFELKVLKASNWLDLSVTPEVIERNLLKFLTKQLTSLENIQIKECSLNVIEHLFNKMPALKFLGIPMHEVEDLKLNLNKNITELTIPNVIRPQNMEKILKNVPNLTKLKVYKLTDEILTIIQRNLPTLAEMSAFCYSPVRVSQNFVMEAWESESESEPDYESADSD